MEIKRKLQQQYTYQKKIDFKVKIIIRDKEGQQIMTKGTIQEEDIPIVNIYMQASLVAHQ